jgi:energy-coupling factor transporter transmembrane protein EcfT
MTALIFIMFYTYAGGDWMPAWRFYSAMIPLFSVMMAVIWNNYIFKIEKNSVLKSVWIVLIFVFCGFVQVINSFKDSNMKPEAKFWYYQVEGLKVIGKWFHQTLPAKTLVATFPNGAFSYYNELPTIDYGGLTDNIVGRFGNKKKTGGNPGHISENTKYILSKKPDIIAIMDGAGFVNNIQSLQEFPGYEAVTFYFSNYTNPQGEYVNINIRTDRKEEIVNCLLQDENVKLIKPNTP